MIFGKINMILLNKFEGNFTHLKVFVNFKPSKFQWLEPIKICFTENIHFAWTNWFFPDDSYSIVSNHMPGD